MRHIHFRRHLVFIADSAQYLRGGEKQLFLFSFFSLMKSDVQEQHVLELIYCVIFFSHSFIPSFKTKLSSGMSAKKQDSFSLFFCCIFCQKMNKSQQNFNFFQVKTESFSTVSSQFLKGGRKKSIRKRQRRRPNLMRNFATL